MKKLLIGAAALSMIATPIAASAEPFGHDGGARWSHDDGGRSPHRSSASSSRGTDRSRSQTRYASTRRPWRPANRGSGSGRPSTSTATPPHNRTPITGQLSQRALAWAWEAEPGSQTGAKAVVVPSYPGD